mgnify:CR=1 FL=1
MNLAVIACHVLNRELSLACAESPNVTRVFWLEQGLHNTPELLRQRIQNCIGEIDRYQEYTRRHYSAHKLFDAVVLGYGLCSNGVVGVQAGSLPLTVPRCDDCIALFLGSQQRYLQEFGSRDGIYWYNPGWIETGSTPSAEYYAEKLERYRRQYGEDNARYLMEAENGWISEYQNCVYIRSPRFPHPDYEEYTRRAAQQYGWQYHCLEGDDNLLRHLVNGPWPDDLFLTCQPGERIEAEYTGKKVRAAAASTQIVQKT